MSDFKIISEAERRIAEFTGAPHAVLTDCCTHAIELALRYDRVKSCEFTPFTYLSVPMTMHKLGVVYSYLPEEEQTWIGEYQFHGTRIWDSARRMEHGMYRAGQIQCLSFGWGKPMYAGRGGAILTDDVEVWKALSQARSDGRDLLGYDVWPEQRVFNVGYHYRCTIEEAQRCLDAIRRYESKTPEFHSYPDLRKVAIR